MNPFKVQKIINECSRNGERLIIEELNEKCGVRLRHVHLIMSEDMFESESCKGIPRHWVKGVSAFGWATLWTYRNPQQKDYSSFVPEGVKLKSYAELKSMNETESNQITDDSKEI